MAAVGLLTVTVSQLSTTSRVAPPTMGAAAPDIPPPMATHVIKTSTRLLWYLRGTLVGLAFFDSEISAAEKVQMATALSKSGEDSPEPPVESPNESIGSQLALSHFVSSNTKKFFAAGLTNSKNIFRACIL